MENEEDMKTKRAEAVEELRAAFAEIESGEGLTRLVGGHGIQSRVFDASRTPASFRTRRRRRGMTRRSARRSGWLFSC